MRVARWTSISLLVVASAASAVAAGPEEWFPNALFTGANSPTGLHAADMDLDGDGDIVQTTTTNVRVTRRTGASAFASPVTISSVGVRDGKIGHLNTDAFPDIAAIKHVGSAIVCTISNGVGGYSTTEMTVPFVPEGLLITDANRDGSPDVVAFSGTRILLLVGDGSGWFAAPMVRTMPAQIRDFVAIDADGDGDVELAIVYANGQPGVCFYELDLLGLPDNASLIIGAPLYYHALAVGDVEADGFDDIAVTCVHTASVDLYRNDAGSGFFAPLSQATSGDPSKVGFLDFDADGDLDISVVVSRATGARIELVEYQPGILGSAQTLGRWSTGSFVPTDVNSDGLPDMIVGYRGNGSTSEPARFAVNWNLGAGRFGEAFREPAELTQDSPMLAHDIDDDGHLDLVYLDNDYPTQSCGLYVLKGTGTGTFQPPSSLGIGYSSRGLLIADVNGDGLPDAAAYRNGLDVLVVLNTSGLLNALSVIATAPPGMQLRSLDFADIDSDGDLDAVVGFGSGIGVARNNGSGSFAPFELAGSGQIDKISCGDLDGDGDIDVLCGNSDAWQVFKNDGTGALTLHQEGTITLGVARTPFELADWDNDGDLDFFCRGGSSTITGYRNNGAGTFTPWVAWNIGAPQESEWYVEQPGAIQIADIDNNGFLDMACADSSLGRITVVRGNGTSAPSLYYFGSASGSYGIFSHIAIGDFNGDGRQDLASGPLDILVQNGPRTLPADGACCTPSGACVQNVSGYECTDLGGLFLGPMSTCLGVNCAVPPPPIGACCLGPYQCEQITASECDAVLGSYFGDGVSCSFGPCDPVGACCTAPYQCVALTSADCAAAGGGYLGDDATCEQGDCDPVGACCVNDYLCESLTAAQCDGLLGTYLGDAVACTSGVCDPVGACCISIGECDFLTAAQCESVEGAYKGDGSGCLLGICDTPTGACCFACSPAGPGAPCPDYTSAPAFCLDMTATDCAGAHGQYRGDTSNCAIVACVCVADVNGDGRTNATDFSMLAAHFGQAPEACMSRSQGDLNCDGAVSLADFLILAGDFGCAE